MKIIHKYLYLFCFSVILIFISFYGYKSANIALPHFAVECPASSNVKEISIFDAQNGNYYVFLPAYADMEHVTVSLPSYPKKYAIDDIILYNGMECGNFSLGCPYTFWVNHKQIATLFFYRSENVATMYIDTASESMEYIHADKNYEEKARVTLYSDAGNINCYDENSTIKGRGNATWGFDKRPYSLSLSVESSLLGMGSALNWVLLANAYDETNLNNKLVLDMASQVGLSGTPESRWVDIYLNGEYNGLYLLTEKVEVHENRLNIDTNSGDFLCKIDLGERWDSLRNPFLSASGRAVEVSYPVALADTEAIAIEHLVNGMERSLLSATDLQDSTIIDLDSWVRKYLLDEISGNIDSDLASCYFYFTDGVFFAGPAWDYDMAFGNNPRNQSPCSFIAKNPQKGSDLFSPYFSSLYGNKSFYTRMVELYTTQFRPIIQQWLDEEIDCLSASIRSASQMNSLRWHAMFDEMHHSNPDTVHTPAALKTYLSSRIRFLDSAWLENKDYCTVQFEFMPGVGYWNTSVQKGDYLETTYMDIVSTVWVDPATGEAFDFRQPIMADMILSKQPEAPASVKDTPATRDYSKVLILAVFLIILIGFVIMDVTYRWKERRSANEHNGTKVSS